MTPLSSSETIAGGEYIGFSTDGACLSILSRGVYTQQMAQAFEDVTKGKVKLVSVDEGTLLVDPATVVVRNMFATDAATLRGMIVSALNAMNGLKFPGVSGCGGVSLVDGVIYRTDEKILPKAPPKKDAPFGGWATAVLVVGLGILAIAALIGVREFKASTGIA